VCETCSFTLRENWKLRASENRVLRREYLHLRRVKWQTTGENCIMRNSMVYTLHKILMGGACNASGRECWQTFRKSLLPPNRCNIPKDGHLQTCGRDNLKHYLNLSGPVIFYWYDGYEFPILCQVIFARLKIIVVDHVVGVKLSLWTSAANGPVVHSHPPNDTGLWVCNRVRMLLKGEHRKTR
jgi:hypothetical protein